MRPAEREAQRVGVVRQQPDPAETARLLMAANRAHLLDTFGSGRPKRGARRRATAALLALWERLLA